MSDTSRLNNVCTFVSDDGSKCSWIDHVLASACIDRLISKMAVLDNVIVSDHKPFSFSVNCNILVKNGNSSQNTVCYEHWSSCNDDTHCNYEIFLDNLLKQVDIPTDVFNSASTEVYSKNCLDRFCGNIINCIKLAVSTAIPQHKCHYDQQFNDFGWNTYVKEKHDFARDAYLSWMVNHLW